MKIGIFTDAYTPAISGVVTSIKMLAEGLRASGHEVYIFTTKLDMPNEELDEIESKYVVRFKALDLPFKALSGYRFSMKLNHKASYIKKHYKLDVIHIQTEFSMGKLGIKVAKKMNIPYVYTFHTMYEEYLPYVSKVIDKYFHKSFFSVLKKMFITPINKNAKVIIVPTKKVFDQHENYLLTGDIRIVPTGLDLDKFRVEVDSSELKQLRSKLGINDDAFIFLSLGRLSKEKSIDIVIRSYANSQKGKNSVLLIVGDGPASDGLKDLAKKLDIDNQVIFAGFVDWQDTIKYYKLGDVFVNASKSETQGLTYIEALASSLPVLVQSDECLLDVVYNDYNGFLFDGEIELASIMNDIEKNKNKISDLKKNCSKSVEKFSKICYANSVQQIYLDALSKKE